MGRNGLVIVAAVLLLSGEQSVAQEAITDVAETDTAGAMSRAGFAASNAFRQTRDGFADAAMSPLEDLNLRRDVIPPVLAMLDNPYDLPHALGCYEISAMIQDLDYVLGSDWDNPQSKDKQWDDRAADGVASAALSAVSSEATGMIPFRGVVRKLSQAEKHEKSLRRAYKIGEQRRAFLKGIGHAKGCIGSAAPRWVEPQEGMPVLYRQIQMSEDKQKELEDAKLEEEAAKSLEASTPSEPSQP